MQKEMNDVLAFHEKFGCYIGEPMAGSGTVPPMPELMRTLTSRYIAHLRSTNIPGAHRLSYMLEECALELHDAMRDGDRLGMFDALLDILYFVYGTAVSFGITTDQMERGWDEIQRVNMSKIRVEGKDKIQKPADYKPPDLQACLDIDLKTVCKEPMGNGYDTFTCLDCGHLNPMVMSSSSMQALLDASTKVNCEKCGTTFKIH